MKTMYRTHRYFPRRRRRYPYPNEAEPGYFAGKILDTITAAITCMGTITLFVYLATF